MSNKTSNMTEGNIFKHLLLFFFPLFIGNLFQQAYSMADAVIVSRGIGDDAFAAIGATNMINFLIMGFIFGLTGGFGIHMSQSFGARDLTRLHRQIVNAGALVLFLGVFATVSCLLWLRPVFELINTPDNIIEDAIAYYSIIVEGVTVSLFCNLCYTVLRSVGNSRTPLISTVISSVVNIVLDWLLVMPLGMGVRGAAIATIFSQVVSGGICLYAILKTNELRLTRDDMKIEKEHIFQMLKTGFPVALMNAVTAGGCMILQNIVNLMGSAYVACYAACIKINNIFHQSGVAIGIAMLTFVGQNKGAGRLDRVHDSLRKSLLLGFLLNIPAIICSLFFPKFLAGLILNEAETIEHATEFLPLTGVGVLAISALFSYRNSVQGLGNTFLPMFSGILEVVCRFIGGATVAKVGFYGVAIAEVAAWTVACLFLAGCFYYEFFKQKKAALSQ